MIFDVRTLILVLIITRLIQVVIFSYQLRSGKEYNDIKYWLLWSICDILGFGIMFFRQFESLFNFVVVMQNTFILLSIVFLYLGTVKFLGLKPPAKAIIFSTVLYVTALAFFSFVTDNLFVRSFIVNTYLFLYSLIAGIVIYRNSGKEKKLQKLLSLTFIAFSSVLLLRIYAVLFELYDLKDMFDPHPVNIISFFTIITVSIIWTYSYIVLINERVTSELQKSGDRFKLLFNTSPDAATLTRMSDGLIIYANKNFCDIVGIDEKQAQGKKTSDFNIWVYPEERIKIVEMLKSKGECNNVEVWVNRAGTAIKCLFSAKKILLNGEDHIIAVSRDITEFIKLKSESAEAGKKWKMTFDAIPEAVFILNNDGVVVNLNSSSCLLLNKKEEDMIGKHCWELVHSSNGHIENCPFLRMKESKARESMLLPIEGKWFEVTTDPIFNEKKELDGAVHIIADVTDRKKAEDDLRSTAAELKQFNELMIDRELRMTELKEEINEILKACGKEPKY